MSTATEVKLPTPTREIEITRQGEYAVPPDPFPYMTVGQTVRYKSTAGEVEIKFTGPSPFRLDKKEGTTVPGDVILTLVQSSDDLPEDKFHCACFIILSDGRKIGWEEGSSHSGGDPRVGRP